MQSNCMLFHKKQPSFEGGEADTNLCYLRCRKVPPYTVGTHIKRDASGFNI